MPTNYSPRPDCPLSIRVACYSGYRDEETPRSFILGSRKVGIERIIDRWLAPDHRYFKIIGDDEGTYIIRHDVKNQTWELTFFKDKDLTT